MRGFLKQHGLAIALIVLSLIAVAFTFAADPEPTFPAREQHTIDSIKVTTPIYYAKRDTLILRETTYVTRSVVAHEAARTARQHADSIKQHADSLEALADSAVANADLWRETAETRGEEAQQLRHANDSLTVAWLSEHLARLQADARASLDSARVVALADLNQRIVRDVRQDCRVLGVVRCPSRTESFIAGSLTTLAAVVAAR